MLYGLPRRGPQLLGEVGRGWRQQQQQRLGGLVPGRAVHHAASLACGQVVGELHQGRQHGVEAEALHVLGDAADRLVGQVTDLVGLTQHPMTVRLGGIQRQVPDAVEPAADADDAGIVPVAALLPGADEHQVGAHGIRAQRVARNRPG